MPRSWSKPSPMSSMPAGAWRFAPYSRRPKRFRSSGSQTIWSERDWWKRLRAKWQHDGDQHPRHRAGRQATGNPDRGRARDSRGGRFLTPLIGRETELGFLIKRWENAMEGEGQALLLQGAAGIGKSRLLQ